MKVKRKKILILHTTPTAFAPPWNEGLKNNLLAWMLDLGNVFDFDIITNINYNTPENINLIIINNKNRTIAEKAWFSVQIAFKAKELLRKNKYHAVWFNINSYNILLLILLIRINNGAKKILILGSERLIKHIEEFKVRVGKSPYVLKKHIVGYFDGVVTVSKKLKRETEALNIKGTKVIYYPALSIAQVKKVKPEKIDGAHLLLGLQKRKYYITYIGNAHKTRGWKTLMEAMIRIRDLDDIELLFCWNQIGDLDKVDEVIKEYKLDNKVRILHNIELSQIFPATKIFILPSSNQMNVLEYPLTIIESLYFGKPVICTNHESFKEIIIDGYNGELFEPDNAKQLSSSIRKLYKDRAYYNRLRRNTKPSLNKIYNKKRDLVQFILD